MRSQTVGHALVADGPLQPEVHFGHQVAGLLLHPRIVAEHDAGAVLNAAEHDGDEPVAGRLAVGRGRPPKGVDGRVDLVERVYPRTPFFGMCVEPDRGHRWGAERGPPPVTDSGAVNSISADTGEKWLGEVGETAEQRNTKRKDR